MGQTFVYRWFGWGRVPKAERPDLEAEGIVLLDEGVGGSVTFIRFRGPNCYFGRRWSAFSGSVVLTRQRFFVHAGVQHLRRVLDLPLRDERLRRVESSVDGKGRLCLAYDAEILGPKYSGRVECRISTDQARLFHEHLQRISNES